MDPNLTADSLLESTLHDRERREERDIAKVTLQEARRYGMKETSHQGRRKKKGVVKYYYAGHVFVYDELSNKAITSYKYDHDRDLYSGQGGTKSTSEEIIQHTAKEQESEDTPAIPQTERIQTYQIRDSIHPTHCHSKKQFP